MTATLLINRMPLFSGLTVMIVLVILLALCIVLSPLLIFLYAALNGTADSGLGQRIGFVKLVGTIYDLVFVYLNLIFLMVCNLSTTYRSIVMLTSVFRATVNKSLLDMDTKFTSLSSTIYTLVLLLVLESGSSSSAGSTGLAVAMCTQFFLIFFKLVQDKIMLQNLARPLQDLNENRLSKVYKRVT
jgi:hypothetical protein